MRLYFHYPERLNNNRFKTRITYINVDSGNVDKYYNSPNMLDYISDAMRINMMEKYIENPNLRDAFSSVDNIITSTSDMMGNLIGLISETINMNEKEKVEYYKRVELDWRKKKLTSNSVDMCKKYIEFMGGNNDR